MQTNRTTKIVGFSISPAIVNEFEIIANEEGRNKSELFREMFRVYQRYRSYRTTQEDEWVMNLIAQAQKEQKERPMSQGELLNELKEIGRYGLHQVKKLGIKEKDINRIIYDARKRRRA